MKKRLIQEMFDSWGLGTGWEQYERGEKELFERGFKDEDYEQALKALANWCEV